LCGQLSATASSIHICTINAKIALHLLNTSRSQVALRWVRYFIPDSIGVALAFKYLIGVDAGKLPGIGGLSSGGVNPDRVNEYLR
jgi:UDP-N-acetyl-D-mannosaminuronic acid transferase (WecB/TagA/CpsF family)